MGKQQYTYNPDKNKKLKAERGISFDDVIDGNEASMTKETKKHQKVTLDEYEQEIEDNLGKARRLSPEEEKKEIEIAKQAAANYKRRKKEERISIRVFANDLQKIKEIAEDEGLAYQTLITSVLHKFATGRLKDMHHR